MSKVFGPVALKPSKWAHRLRLTQVGSDLTAYRGIDRVSRRPRR